MGKVRISMGETNPITTTATFLSLPHLVCERKREREMGGGRDRQGGARRDERESAVAVLSRAHKIRERGRRRSLVVFFWM
ncbi:hypothetical protein Sjap_005336 [Stephania japonica]|uniref:Uncharacterized protein n=1 Tax=Stephania japonica TaxID=461633 RepID=A0AAP0PHR9_9MAGN